MKTKKHKEKGQMASLCCSAWLGSGSSFRSGVQLLWPQWYWKWRHKITILAIQSASHKKTVDRLDSTQAGVTTSDQAALEQPEKGFHPVRLSKPRRLQAFLLQIPDWCFQACTDHFYGKAPNIYRREDGTYFILPNVPGQPRPWLARSVRPHNP